jgi:hypothetical protein
MAWCRFLFRADDDTVGAFRRADDDTVGALVHRE